MRALTLLSGGIDSATCLYIANRDNAEVAAISVDYGQRHHREMESARAICHKLGCDHQILKIPHISNSKLTDPDSDIPNLRYDQIQGVSPSYVPFRNGLMLSYLASIAQAQGYDRIYFGAHAEDAANDAYPDCTLHFVGAMAAAIYIGTYHAVRLVAPFIESNKDQIIEQGARLGVPYDLTWSCYKGEALHCGQCPTCHARAMAFERAGVIDPTTYAHDPKLVGVV